MKLHALGTPHAKKRVLDASREQEAYLETYKRKGGRKSVRVIRACGPRDRGNYKAILEPPNVPDLHFLVVRRLRGDGLGAPAPLRVASSFLG